MQFLKITDPYVTLNSEPYCDVTLEQGNTYLLKKAHAQAIADLGLGQLIEGANYLPLLNLSDMKWQSPSLRCLFLFDGGLGDAISLAILFNALKKKYNFTPNIACKHEIWHHILQPLGFNGEWYQLPVHQNAINGHDRIQPQADRFFQEKEGRWELCIVEELGRAYGFNPDDYPVTYSIPETIHHKMILNRTPKVRIGINFDSNGFIRSYPQDLQPYFINMMNSSDFEIFLLGSEDSKLDGLKEHSTIHDYRGKTTILELAAIIKQMDIVICMDSFIAHLANILRIRTIVLLSTTRKGIFKWHKRIQCMESLIECSPCGEVANDCPRGLDQCQAFFHESISLEKIILMTMNECAAQLHSMIQETMPKRLSNSG